MHRVQGPVFDITTHLPDTSNLRDRESKVAAKAHMLAPKGLERSYMVLATVMDIDQSLAIAKHFNYEGKSTGHWSDDGNVDVMLTKNTAWTKTYPRVNNPNPTGTIWFASSPYAI